MIFYHNITSYGNRDRIAQEFVNNGALSLLNKMNKCHQSFLSNLPWSCYNSPIEVLYNA